MKDQKVVKGVYLDKLSKEVVRLGLQLNKEVVTVLFLLRFISKDYYPNSHQFTLEEMFLEHDPEKHEITPWRIIEERRGINCSITIIEALGLISDKYEFVRELRDEALYKDLDQEILDELIYLLSHISTFNKKIASVYEMYIEQLYSKKEVDRGNKVLKVLVNEIYKGLELQNQTIYDPYCGSLGMLLGVIEKREQADLHIAGQFLENEERYIFETLCILYGVKGKFKDADKEAVTIDKSLSKANVEIILEQIRAEGIDIPDITPHTCRKIFATRGFEKGIA